MPCYYSSGEKSRGEKSEGGNIFLAKIPGFCQYSEDFDLKPFSEKKIVLIFIDRGAAQGTENSFWYFQSER